MKVKCIDPKGIRLTLNRIYEARAEHDGLIEVVNDDGQRFEYATHRFEILEKDFFTCPDCCVSPCVCFTDDVRSPHYHKPTTPPAQYPDGNPKTRYGVKKPPLHLIPSAGLIDCSIAMALGAKKYGAYNWRKAGVSASVYIAAAKRHLDSFLDGEDIDPESGGHHLGHVMACCSILRDAAACGKLNDDRPVKGEFARLVREFAERAERGEIPALLPKDAA